ncbi:TRAF-type zinc finger domain-containing protein 1 isoform X2 [Dendropsophus ebraccatus]|uniref:TRAF-type zinc finger domain-containing protein 1 isoform X2 n=1 Tax=Dendropsophus ebraccatus TaxID=150705 RepID=UPI0038322D77
MASSAEQETRLCGNCKRDIPADNFTIHEIHCRRNISICKMCQEPIPTSDMKDHYDSEHALVTCKCNKTVEKCALEEHEKSSCPLRLVQCQFCELEVTFNTLENHEDYCGARTEPCEKCGSSVMIKELKEHPAVCGKVKQQKNPVRVNSWADSREYEVPSLTGLNTRRTFTDDLYSRLPRHVPDRFYGRSILTQSLKRFDDINQNTGRHSTNLDFLGQEERSRTFRNSHSQSRKNTQAAPEPADPFADNDLDLWSDFYCKDNKMKTNVRGQNKSNFFPRNESMHLNSSSPPTTDAIQLPCEFCEELFPEEDLILHQSGCRPGVFSSVRRDSPSPPLDFNLRSSPPPADRHQSVLIPCEFCGILMEGDILFHHQDQCDMGPNSEKTSQFSTQTFADNVSPAEDEHRSHRGPAASQSLGRQTALGSNTPIYSRNPIRGAADNSAQRDHSRIDALYRSSTTRHSSLDEMRKKNMEENARMVRNQYQDVFGPTGGASNSRRGR